MFVELVIGSTELIIGGFGERGVVEAVAFGVGFTVAVLVVVVDRRC